MHRLIKNRLLPALALAAALISPSAHAQAASGNDPIKLGLIDIYSGGFAFIADSIRTGFQIAVDEANAAGGLKGRPFGFVLHQVAQRRIAFKADRLIERGGAIRDGLHVDDL